MREISLHVCNRIEQSIGKYIPTILELSAHLSGLFLTYHWLAKHRTYKNGYQTGSQRNTEEDQ